MAISKSWGMRWGESTLTTAFLATKVRRALGMAPCIASTGAPLLNAMNVGIARIPISWAICYPAIKDLH